MPGRAALGRLRRWQQLVAAWAAVFLPLGTVAGLGGSPAARVAVACAAAAAALAVALLATIQFAGLDTTELSLASRGLMRDADPYELGVDPEAPAAVAELGGTWSYVGRACDAALDEAIGTAIRARSAGMIVLSGPSKAGKSRTMYEAAVRVAGHARLIAPANRSQLAALLAEGRGAVRRRRVPVVLWLDDLERFTGVDAEVPAADPQLLARLQRWPQPVIVLATVGGKGVEGRPRDDRHRLGVVVDALLARPGVTEIILGTGELTSGEEIAAARAAFGEHGLSCVAPAIGEYMMAARECRRKLASGCHRRGDRQSPEGQAVVRAAMDWRRVGIIDPISREALRALFPFYYRGGKATAKSFERGLAWALRPLHTTISLLREEDGGYSAFDWLHRVLEETNRPLPRAAWRCMLDLASGEQATIMGLVAYVLGDVRAAMLAWNRDDAAATSIGTLCRDAVLDRRRSPDRPTFHAMLDRVPAWLAEQLAILFAWRGDIDLAVDAHRSNMRRGVVLSAVNAGLLLVRVGDVDGAEAAFRWADEQGSAEGAYSLGVLYDQLRGDPGRAEAAFRRADMRGHADGAAGLGMMLRQRGDAKGAEAAYRRADQRGSAVGAVNLGVMLARRGRRAEADAAYHRADERGSPEAALNLATVLERHADLRGADDALRRADERGSWVAALRRGREFEKRGRLAQAESAYSRAEERGCRLAALELSALYEKRGDHEQADAAFLRGHRGRRA